MPISILHIIWSGARGGAEKNMSDIAVNLDKKKFAMEVLFLQEKGFWGNYLENKGIKVWSLGIKNSFSLKGIISFIKFIKKTKYELYHNHISAPFVKIILKGFKRKVIHTFHCTPLHIQKLNFIKKELEIKFSDFYISPSNFVRDYYKKKYNINSALIYHGVELEPSLRVRTKKHLDSSVCKIGTLTHLEKIKGNDILIKTANILKKNNIKNVKLFIAGSGSEYRKLKEMVKNFKICEMVTICPVKDPVSFLYDIDIYISTSRSESFGISVVEAMSLGLPIVCSDIPSFRELVSDGINGYLCDLEPKQIADRLIGLINSKHLRENFGEASKFIAAKKFTLNNMLEKYEEFYLKCAE